MPPTDHRSRRAVIDIGTNSVKLLVGDLFGGSLNPVTEESKQTRLGAGFYETHQLQQSAITQTAEVVAEYSRKAGQLGVASVRVIATSAARDAVNGGELVDAISKSSGLRVEIITGEQEADWVFRGVTSDPKLAGACVLILDVGGGSTEFIVGEAERQHFRKSYEIGTVRLLEQLRPGDPPGMAALAECRASLKKFMDEQVAPSVEPALRQCGTSARLIGTGGTATILARMEGQMEDFDREKIESVPLRLNQIRAHMEHLWSINLAERRKVPGLPSNRADVILTGLAIYEAIMQTFAFDHLAVSTRGLRYWALLESEP